MLQLTSFWPFLCLIAFVHEIISTEIQASRHRLLSASNLENKNDNKLQQRIRGKNYLPVSKDIPHSRSKPQRTMAILNYRAQSTFDSEHNLYKGDIVDLYTQSSNKKWCMVEIIQSKRQDVASLKRAGRNPLKYVPCVYLCNTETIKEPEPLSFLDSSEILKKLGDPPIPLKAKMVIDFELSDGTTLVMGQPVYVLFPLGMYACEIAFFKEINGDYIQAIAPWSLLRFEKDQKSQAIASWKTSKQSPHTFLTTCEFHEKVWYPLIKLPKKISFMVKDTLPTLVIESEVSKIKQEYVVVLAQNGDWCKIALLEENSDGNAPTQIPDLYYVPGDASGIGEWRTSLMAMPRFSISTLPSISLLKPLYDFGGLLQEFSPKSNIISVSKNQEYWVFNILYEKAPDWIEVQCIETRKWGYVPIGYFIDTKNDDWPLDSKSAIGINGLELPTDIKAVNPLVLTLDKKTMIHLVSYEPNIGGSTIDNKESKYVFHEKLKSALSDKIQKPFPCQEYNQLVNYINQQFWKSTDLKIQNEYFLKHKIVEKLGKGAYGVVYKVQDKLTGNFYAIKVIKIESTETYKQALNEIRALVALGDSKHVPKIHYVTLNRLKITEEMVPTITIFMDHIPGQVLQDFIRAMRFVDIKTLSKLAWHLTNILVYIHKKGYIHRDLKPSNILVNTKDDDTCVLCDFGTCWDINECGIPEGLRIATTYVYAAPEILKYQKYDERSDVWSMGACILYAHRRSLYQEIIDEKNDDNVMIKLLSTFYTPENFKFEIKGVKQKDIKGYPVKSTDQFDNDLKDFLQCCFQTKDNRAHAKDLLNHQFMKRHNPSES